jgi:hypothetical protein
MPVWTWRDSLPYLNPNAALPDLPPRPALHEGLKAKLTLIRAAQGGEGRDVLRVYKTSLAAAEGELYEPIYLISLTREVKGQGFGLYAIPGVQPASREDVTGLQKLVAAAPGLTVMARQRREGQTLDLISAKP